ncbi:hypothetical protein RSOL_489440 [Rhizoctonia solani AG-3 Rhs1AP]|uniref:DUF6532 domain-containing protein n=1 Tax=Rhizoctonia solani AG-3 Rhs1AP TaxID=1086054 RepID=X8JI25_9AGAM|nr:hypothetical protein RSOL_489440 [Rhizoctonia solani AG-3 Rhs1AP]
MEEDTATESETDDESIRTADSAARLAAKHIVAGCIGGPTRLDDRPRPPQRGTRVPHPTRDNTPATVIDFQPSNTSSHLLGDPLPQRPSDSRFRQDILTSRLAEKLAEWSSHPLQGPAHARLRSEIILRYLADASCNSDAGDPQPSDADGLAACNMRLFLPSLPPSHPPPSSRPRTAVTEAADTDTDVDEVPETDFGTQSNGSGRATHGSARTYAGSCSHQSDSLPRSAALVDEPTDVNNAVEEVSRPNSPSLTPAEEGTSAQVTAYAKRTWPLRPSRVRKPKPLARDVSGIDRQVLTMAKIHLLAYALVHGRFLQWASDVHEATSQVELPDQPYNRPEHEIYEFMVNSIATRRGKAKEHLREFVARVSGFRQNLKKHKVIQRNEDIFNRLYPNNFHCLESNPRRGDYEHPEIGHCIALILFHGPNSVGVLYPKYFLNTFAYSGNFALRNGQMAGVQMATSVRGLCVKSTRPT